MQAKWHATLSAGTCHSDFMSPSVFWTTSIIPHPRANKEDTFNAFM
jgi:hypothetical protein